MKRNRFFALLTSLTLMALVFSHYSVAEAKTISFGGEVYDNFWQIDTQYCRDGFSVTVSQTQLSNQNLPFWLELGSSSVPVTVQTGVDPSARIAYGDGSSMVNNGQPFTVNFLFTKLQTAGTSITTTIERWDHNQQSIQEPDEDGDLDQINAIQDGDADDFSDESDFDDVLTDTETIGNCLIDSVAPAITISSPLAQNYPQTATVSAAWSVTDNLSGVASSSGQVDGTSVSNGQPLDLLSFKPGPHVLAVNASDNSGNTSQASVTFNVTATIDSLIAATQRACSTGGISNAGVCQSLLAKLNAAKVANGHGQTQAANNALNAYLLALQAQKGKTVNQSAFDLLSADVQALLH